MNALSSEFCAKNELVVPEFSFRGVGNKSRVVSLVYDLTVTGEGTETDPLVVGGQYMRSPYAMHHELMREIKA